MTRFGHYRLAFLLSILIFLILGSIYLSLPKVKTKLKNPKNSIIKIALITPIKAVPKAIPKAIIPPVPIVKKVIPPKPKKIVKKKVVKKPKKVIKKPMKLVKKAKPKRVVKKRVIKKKIVKKIIHKKVVIPKNVEREFIVEQKPYIAPSYYEPKPIIRQQTVIPTRQSRSIVVPAPVAQPNKPTDNGQAQKKFLKGIRSKIQANKKYPRLASRRHIEGSSKVRFDITANGEVTNIRFINGKSIFHKSIRKTLKKIFPVSIPANMQGKLPIYDVAITLHFNIR